MKEGTKRVIAREILIFFGAIALIGIIWTGLWIRNVYFDKNPEVVFSYVNGDGLPVFKTVEPIQPEHTVIFLDCTLLLLIIAYPLRVVFYLSKWAIITLKNQDASQGHAT